MNYQKCQENDEIISGLDFIEKDYELALEKIKNNLIKNLTKQNIENKL